MDRYHKNSKEWGGKGRKRDSRQGKSNERQEAVREAIEETLEPQEFIMVGDRMGARMVWLDPQHDQSLGAKFVLGPGDEVACSGCHEPLESGHRPVGVTFNYIECCNCLVRYQIFSKPEKKK